VTGRSAHQADVVAVGIGQDTPPETRPAPAVRRRTEHSFRLAAGCTAAGHQSMQIGGSARVLQNSSITECDAIRELAGIRPVTDGPEQP
jgi:hypothetical protein